MTDWEEVPHPFADPANPDTSVATHLWDGGPRPQNEVGHEPRVGMKPISADFTLGGQTYSIGSEPTGDNTGPWTNFNWSPGAPINILDNHVLDALQYLYGDPLDYIQDTISERKIDRLRGWLADRLFSVLVWFDDLYWRVSVGFDNLYWRVRG